VCVRHRYNPAGNLGGACGHHSDNLSAMRISNIACLSRFEYILLGEVGAARNRRPKLRASAAGIDLSCCYPLPATDASKRLVSDAMLQLLLILHPLHHHSPPPDETQIASSLHTSVLRDSMSSDATV